MNQEQDFFSEKFNNSQHQEQGQTLNSKHKRYYIQWIVNILLFIGLIVCIVLILTGKGQYHQSGFEKIHAKIAYINSDSLMHHYDLFQDLKAELEAETLKLRNDLEQRQKSLQNQMVAYQNKIQSGNISYDDAQKTEAYLAQQQQKLIDLSDQYTAQIAQKEYDMSQRVLDSLKVVLDIINEREHFDYILGYTPGAGILYANPALEITMPVVEILNERYAKGKKNSKNEK